MYDIPRNLAIIVLSVFISGFKVGNNKIKNIARSHGVLKNRSTIDSVKIDSIIVYTAVFVKFPLFTPFYYYQDSLFCNYDSLKNQAIQRKQVYRCVNCQPLLDSIYYEIKKNRQFVKVNNDSSSQVLQSFGDRNCQLKEEISDLFEVYFGGKKIRIGVVRDRKSFCYFEGSIYHFKKRDKLFALLYRYRTSTKYH